MNESTVSRGRLDNCPIPQSKDVTGMKFTGHHEIYTKADTWYPSWAKDGRMYSAFTDGVVNDLEVYSFNRPVVGLAASVGHVVISGEAPQDLEFKEAAAFEVNTNDDYSGRYPCANLFHNDIWYHGSYALAEADYEGYNWPIMGPFCGFHISYDKGNTWTKSPWNPEVGNTLFTEPAIRKGPVKFGSPHVVDFGCNMEHSPDGKMYMVAHGSTLADNVRRKANCSWITGDQVYLCRVDVSPETVNAPSAYEFFSGYQDDGSVRWTSSLEECQPLVEWEGKMGCTTVTYNPGLKKYLMAVTDGRETTRNMDSYILEADEITGPYRMVWQQENFGPQAYFLTFPSRFISADGIKAWLCYSANFWPCDDDKRYDPQQGDPIGSCYRMCLQEVEFSISN